MHTSKTSRIQILGNYTWLSICMYICIVFHVCNIVCMFVDIWFSLFFAIWLSWPQVINQHIVMCTTWRITCLLIYINYPKLVSLSGVTKSYATTSRSCNIPQWSILQNRFITGGLVAGGRRHTATTPLVDHGEQPSQSSRQPHDGVVRGRKGVAAACAGSSRTDVQIDRSRDHRCPQWRRQVWAKGLKLSQI